MPRSFSIETGAFHTPV